MTNERENDPLGLGPRDREQSGTGSTDDTSYDAAGSDPYRTGEPRKDVNDRAAATPDRSRVTPADPDVPSSDEP